jgi:hypothetical protein
MNTTNTNIVAAAAVLATMLASPALAQRVPRATHPSELGERYDQPRQHSVNPSFDVYQNGEYLGSDPDPNIRLQLRRGHGPEGEW